MINIDKWDTGFIRTDGKQTRGIFLKSRGNSLVELIENAKIIESDIKGNSFAEYPLVMAHDDVRCACVEKLRAAN